MKNTFLQKFYYGDIPEEKGAASQHTSTPDTTQWPLWKYLSAAINGDWTINMPAVCMRPMPQWPSKMQEMCIPAGWKVSQHLGGGK